MPVFKRNDGKEVAGTISLVQGNVLRLKLDGSSKGGQVTHYCVKTSCP